MHRDQSIFIGKILLVSRQHKTAKRVLFFLGESGSGFAVRHAKRLSNLASRRAGSRRFEPSALHSSTNSRDRPYRNARLIWGK